MRQPADGKTGAVYGTTGLAEAVSVKLLRINPAWTLPVVKVDTSRIDRFGQGTPRPGWRGSGMVAIEQVMKDEGNITKMKKHEHNK
jgi:hypothetical protein